MEKLQKNVKKGVDNAFGEGKADEIAAGVHLLVGDRGKAEKLLAKSEAERDGASGGSVSAAVDSSVPAPVEAAAVDSSVPVPVEAAAMTKHSKDMYADMLPNDIAALKLSGACHRDEDE